MSLSMYDSTGKTDSNSMDFHLLQSTDQFVGPNIRDSAGYNR